MSYSRALSRRPLGRTRRLVSTNWPPRWRTGAVPPIQRLTAALGSARFRELLVDLAEWLDVGDWQLQVGRSRRDRRDKTIEVFTAGELERRWRKLLKCAVDLDKLDDQGPPPCQDRRQEATLYGGVLRASLPCSATRGTSGSCNSLEDLQDNSRQAQRSAGGGPFPCPSRGGNSAPQAARQGCSHALCRRPDRPGARARRQQQAHAPGRRGRSEARRHRSVLAVGLHGARAHRSSLWMCK